MTSTRNETDEAIESSPADCEMYNCKPVTSSPLRSTDNSSSDVPTPDSGIQMTDTKDAPKTKKPKKKHKNQPPDADLLPPCRVCGEKASGLHYGANTCEPCKGFFRRSIVKVEKKNEEYICTKGNNCTLGTGKRTKCSYCRYKKCLEVGMSHGAIKIGRYTYEKRTNDIKEVKQLQKVEKMLKGYTDISVAEEHVDDLVEKLIQIQEEFTSDFRQNFLPDGLLDIQLSIYESYKMKFEIFGNLGVLPWSVYEEFHDATGIDLDDRKIKMSAIAARLDAGIRNMITFAKSLPGFNDLLTSDQLALLKAGFLEYWFLGHHRRLNTDLKVIVCNCQRMAKKGAHVSEITPLIDQKHLDQIFEYAASIQKCQLTVEEVTLSRGIVLTFSDRCKLEEPDKVDKIQWDLVKSLRTVAGKNYTNPDERIWQIFDKFSLLREFAEYSREINSIRAKWSVMQDHPLVLEMIHPELNPL